MATVEQCFLRSAADFLREQFLPKIKEAVESLSDEEIWARPNQSSNSIGNLLVHLAGNVRQHVIAGLGGAEDVRVRHREFKEESRPPLSELIEQLEQTVNEACSVLENLDPELLTQMKVIQDERCRVMEDIIHVVEHFSYHTGQIIYQVKAVKDVSFPWYDYLKET